jgi:hypothetical protein
MREKEQCAFLLVQLKIRFVIIWLDLFFVVIVSSLIELLLLGPPTFFDWFC